MYPSDVMANEMIPTTIMIPERALFRKMMRACGKHGKKEPAELLMKFGCVDESLVE